MKLTRTLLLATAVLVACRARAAEPAARLTVLVDNTSVRPDVKAVWGFACLVEAHGHTVLFDTGADPVILRDNLAAMKMDPARIEAVVISHFHRDHTWGAPGLGVLANVRAYTPHALDGFIKDAAALDAAGLARVPVTNVTPLFDGLSIAEPMSFGPTNADTWEQSLVIDTPRGLVVVVGCSHPGITGMIAQIKRRTNRPVDLVFGGFHLGGRPVDEVRSIAATLKTLGVARVGATHCTGDDSAAVIRDVYGDDYVPGGAGTVIVIDTVAPDNSQ